jgi:intein/homing endonuclease
MGIADCYASKSAEVAQTLLETRAKVDDVLNNPPENKTPAQIEGIIQTILNGAMNIGPKLAKDSMSMGDFNALNIMRNSGAKGSVINLSQIVAMVGQQNIKGCRMPQQLSHGTRCLPSFLKGDNTPDARGFVEHNYIQGLTPQEAFFHAAAGRDGVISTALKSVTGETPIVITENGISKYYKIGDWVDNLLADNSKNVHFREEREMELLDVSHLNLRIPTTDEKGNVTWGEIKNVTRHDPGKELYHIQTLSGRSVVVTESKALLIWDFDKEEFVQKDTPSVRIGDFAPTTRNLEASEYPQKTNLNGTLFNGQFLGMFINLGNVENDLITFEANTIISSAILLDFAKRWFRDNDVSIIEETDCKIVGRSTSASQVLKYSIYQENTKEKCVPAYIFNESLEFRKGFIRGFVATTSNSVQKRRCISHPSERIITDIAMLLSRDSIFTEMCSSPMCYKLVIADEDTDAYLELMDIGGVDINTNSIIKYTRQNDVVLDEIVAIEKVTIQEYIEIFPQYKGKVYDLTVPSTLNFGLANGLHVVDTADTGYLQKRMGRKLEDAKVWYDGSVRDANGSIISFLYGDDGMEAKKVVPVKGLNVPFFVNPYLLARQLNSQVKSLLRNNSEEDPGELRKLSAEEIQFMCEYINFSHIQSEVTKVATQNARETLAEIVKNVEIYESKIADFIVEIKSAYDNSKAPYGYAAGLVSTSSLGEPNSQSTLNVFHLTGVGGGKSESVGVARFRELINATKSPKQSHPGCTIYFNDGTLIENSKIVSSLEDQNKTSASSEIEQKIKAVKEESLGFVENKGKEIDQTYVKQFLKDWDLKYLPSITPDGVEIPKNSPLGILTYEEYREEWWVTLNRNLEIGEEPEGARSWVLVLHFDVEKLYKFKIDLEDISFAIEDSSVCALTCVVSPNVIGRIEVYADIDQIRSHMKLKFTDSEKGVITPENSDYYIMRDPITEFVKKTRISGIDGVAKTYSREDLSTHEWIMDTDGGCFLDILTMPNVDTHRTVTNDMHEILKVLGIEAARRFEFEDITRVISYDGTYINPRHISILVDVMTFSGGLTAASRDGISRDIVGPNAKIMFEKSVDNAMIASAFGEVDNMTSLASSIMFGKVALTGTKMVDICTQNSIGKQPPLKPIKSKNERVEESKVEIKSAKSKTLPLKSKSKK